MRSPLPTLLASVLVLACAAPLRAQTVSTRSAGAFYTAVDLEYPGHVRSGAGAWLTYDVMPVLGLDVSGSVFPSRDRPGGRMWQFLAGPRAGVRAGRVAAFARVRPGVVRFSEPFLAPDTVCIAIFPTPDACLARRTNFAVDAGGTIEFELSGRGRLRIDLGDALIRFARAGRDAAWTHNLQFVAGAGLAF